MTSGYKVSLGRDPHNFKVFLVNGVIHALRGDTDIARIGTRPKRVL